MNQRVGPAASVLYLALIQVMISDPRSVVGMLSAINPAEVGVNVEEPYFSGQVRGNNGFIIYSIDSLFAITTSRGRSRCDSF